MKTAALQILGAWVACNGVVLFPLRCHYHAGPHRDAPFTQGDGMPLLESDEESISGRLASQLLRRVSEDRDGSDVRGRPTALDSGAAGAGATASGGASAAGGWLPLPRFWPQSSASEPSGAF